MPQHLLGTRPKSKLIERNALGGLWQREVVPAAIVGTARDVTIYRAARKSDFIKFAWHGDKETFCPPAWSDLAIGSGACGFGCRCCFLMLTFRSMRDPLAPLIYSNVEDFAAAVRDWLSDPQRRRQHTLGLGIDCSDSLLYEGITGHARRLIPMFANPKINPTGNRLILLTKSKNTQYLEGLPTSNVAVTFSLNPEPIADLWEGWWPDTLERITPPIAERLAACLHAQRMGFEVRWRIDPILTPPAWERAYDGFFAEAAGMGIRPRYVTFGTYREKTPLLDTWREKWGLPAMEWEPSAVAKEGTHLHVPESDRVKVYEVVRDLCREHLPDSRVSLCKETHAVRKQLRMCNADCNCLP